MICSKLRSQIPSKALVYFISTKAKNCLILPDIEASNPLISELLASVFGSDVCLLRMSEDFANVMRIALKETFV